MHNSCGGCGGCGGFDHRIIDYNLFYECQKEAAKDQVQIIIAIVAHINFDYYHFIAS